MQEIEVNQDSFISWLQSRGPNEIVGHTNMESCCPLKNYLANMNPNIVSVYGSTGEMVADDLDILRVKFPDWCSHFVRACDALTNDHREDEYDESVPVTAEQCLGLFL